jgi:2-dehydro-3-deoxy-D-arabinonate dehydratase
MKLAKVLTSQGTERVAVIEGEAARLLPAGTRLRDVLSQPSPKEAVERLLPQAEVAPLASLRLRAPIDDQEVWAAGVTYKRSQIARMEESETGASHYDRVYTAARPEIFFKATPSRVAHPGEPVRVRSDSNWSVPEPEFTLVISPQGKIVGYTVGNDMSARDIEGENPLYLPQAKVYNDCCALGPVIRLADEPLDREGTRIILTIQRGGQKVFEGETNLGQMHRMFDDLVGWLIKENSMPTGAFLLTGTGIVPDNFTLENGDVVSIEITGIGVLTNPVVKD